MCRTSLLNSASTTMKFSCLGTILLTFLTGCVDKQQAIQFGYRNDPEVSNKEGQPIDSGVLYFDPASFRDTFPIPRLVADPPYDTVENVVTVPEDKVKKVFDVRIDSFALQLFSRRLVKSGEPVLSNYYLDKDIIRLTWLRSFHPGIVITFIRRDGKYSIDTRFLDGSDRTERTDSRQLAKKEFEELLAMLVQHNFYASEEVDWLPPDADGSEWILEVHTEAGYRLLNKQSPAIGQSNGLREIGEFMIKRSPASDEEIY